MLIMFLLGILVSDFLKYNLESEIITHLNINIIDNQMKNNLFPLKFSILLHILLLFHQFILLHNIQNNLLSFLH